MNTQNLAQQFHKIAALYTFKKDHQIARIVGERPQNYSAIQTGRRRLTLDKLNDWLKRWNADQCPRMRLIVEGGSAHIEISEGVEIPIARGITLSAATAGEVDQAAAFVRLAFRCSVEQLAEDSQAAGNNRPTKEETALVKQLKGAEERALSLCDLAKRQILGDVENHEWLSAAAWG